MRSFPEPLPRRPFRLPPGRLALRADPDDRLRGDPAMAAAAAVEPGQFDSHEREITTKFTSK